MNSYMLNNIDSLFVPSLTMLNAVKLSELLAKNIDQQLYPRML